MQNRCKTIIFKLRSMGKNRLVKRILDIDIKLIGNINATERVELEKTRYDLVEKMIKLKMKDNE
jgi:hypothetical protein